MTIPKILDYQAKIPSESFVSMDILCDSNNGFHLYTIERITNTDDYVFDTTKREYFLTVDGAILEYIDTRREELSKAQLGDNFKSERVVLVDIQIPRTDSNGKEQLPETIEVTFKRGVYETVDFSFLMHYYEIGSIDLIPVYITGISEVNAKYVTNARETVHFA